MALGVWLIALPGVKLIDRAYWYVITFSINDVCTICQTGELILCLDTFMYKSNDYWSSLQDDRIEVNHEALTAIAFALITVARCKHVRSLLITLEPF